MKHLIGRDRSKDEHPKERKKTRKRTFFCVVGGSLAEGSGVEWSRLRYRKLGDEHVLFFE